jgi:hypothetical protein
MKWLIIISLFILWLAGIIFKIDEGGLLLNSLIIAATILLVFDLFKNKRRNIIKSD